MNQHVPAQPSAPLQHLQWDLFCQVIDNYGDIGVCWRLASALAQRGHRVRLWVDDASALTFMAPQGMPGVTVRDWHGAPPSASEDPTDVLIEAFGCEAPAAFLVNCVRRAADRGCRPVWINLEYLSAESYVERMHRLPSPLQQGPAAGWTRWFFYPGFTPATGGLLRETDLLARQQAFAEHGLAPWRAQAAQSHPAWVHQALWISLFSYEPPALPALLRAARQQPVHLLVTPGRSAAAVRAALGSPEAATPSSDVDFQHQNALKAFSEQRELLSISYLNASTQTGFDHLLWAADLNAVRGEDSLVRALWAGKPLVWQIYPQHDNAHHAKLAAFLDWLDAPASLRRFHALWNGLEGLDPSDSALPGLLPGADLLGEWGACVRAARDRLLAQDDLVTQILGFVDEKR